MQIGIVGLGRTGTRITRRLIGAGHEVVGFDRAEAARFALARDGVITVTSLVELSNRLDPPRICLLVLPPGQPVEDAVALLGQSFSHGDLIIDGAHTSHHRDIGVARELATKGIEYLDMGLSGGASAAEEGYCVMVGGSAEAARLAEPLLLDLAAEGGFAHVGPTGAGHYLKMVHHGVEFALMEAYGAALNHLEAAPGYAYDLDIVDRIWRHSTLPDSWSLERTEAALRPGGTDQAERHLRVARLHGDFIRELGRTPAAD